jgi:HAD superfamily hydrolase (TIGR01457 family)
MAVSTGRRAGAPVRMSEAATARNSAVSVGVTVTSVIGQYQASLRPTGQFVNTLIDLLATRKLLGVSSDWSSLKGVLIDLDGVVYTGRIPIPGAAGFLSEARRRGLKFLLVTNNSTTSPELVAERLHTMHIEVAPDEILTSAQAAVGYVKLHAKPGARVRIVGEAGLRQEAEREGFVVVEDGETTAEWVIAGLDRAFTYAKLAGATRDILRGAHFVATNIDALLPVEGGEVVPGAGTMIAAIQTATSVEPVVLGKPEPGLFEHGLRRLGGLAAHEVAMIGDRLDTDVDGGRRAGLRTILVLTGVTSPAQAAAVQPPPDAISPDLAGVARLVWPQT